MSPGLAMSPPSALSSRAFISASNFPAKGDALLNEVINPTRLRNSSDVRQVTWASYNQCHNLVLPENVCFNASYLEPLELVELGLITPSGEVGGTLRAMQQPRASWKSLTHPLLQSSGEKRQDLGDPVT